LTITIVLVEAADLPMNHPVRQAVRDSDAASGHRVLVIFAWDRRHRRRDF
jgi:hypothetical protein